MKALLLLFFSCVSAQSAPLFTTERPIAIVPAQPNAWVNPYEYCGLSVYGLQPGDWLRIDGFMQVDSPSKQIGVTVKIKYCDPDCNETGRWKGVGAHAWGIGNVYSQGAHHGDYKPWGIYVAGRYIPELKLSVIANIYASEARRPASGIIQDCAMVVVRH